MEKILLAIDAINPDKGALEFACYLAKLTRSKVTGVFLENMVSEANPDLKRMHGATYMDWEVDEQFLKLKTRSELIHNNINQFAERCTREEARYCVHSNKSVPADELIAESRFADVIVVDAETSFNSSYEGSPTEFVKDILKKAECPVIIAPESFDAIEEIVFTFNNTSDSIFAIKLFTYLFPELHDKKVSIIQVNDSEHWNETDKHNFFEWIEGHYTNIHYEGLKGDIDSVLLNCMLKRKDTFLVMGAYGRSSISNFFKRSSADYMIKTMISPLFIAHQ